MKPVIELIYLRKLGGITPLSLGLLAAAFVYGLVLPFCWGNDPADTLGTLSILCEHRVGWFWIWAVLTGAAFALNIARACARYGCRTRLPDLFALLSLFGMLLTAATLNHSIADWNPKRVAHWIGAILYAAFLLAAFIVFSAVSVKRWPRMWLLLGGTIAVGIAVLVRLLAFGRNGYMEIIPIALMELALGLLNYTNLFFAPAETPRPAA